MKIKSLKLICIILICIINIFFFVGCKNNIEDEIWSYTKNFITEQLKIQDDKSLVFPEDYKSDILEIEKNKFLVNSYVIYYPWGACCGKYRKITFNCTLEVKNNNYYILDFEIIK